MATKPALRRRLEELDREGKLPVPVDAAWELVERGYIPADAELIPPAVMTPTPCMRRRSKHFHQGARFDVDEVASKIDALRCLRHTKGRRWARRPLNPEPWQVLWIIAPVFGWVDPLGMRIIRDAWIEIPRKNGKSTLASGLLILLLLADGELGAEVYAAASSREQAGQVFEPAKAMLLGSPQTRGRVKVLASLVRAPRTGGIFRVLSKVAEVAHGLNVSGAVIDEVHVHKSRDLIDAIETGTGARDQPLIIYITTSDDGRRTTIYAEKREEVEILADDRGEPDHEHYGVIWAAAEGLDPFALDTIRQANPGIGVTVSEEYLVGKARKAQRSPSFMPTYERLHLNRRRSAKALAFDMGRWDAGAEPELTLEQARRRLRDRECYGGLDLGSTEDFTAWALVFPDVFKVDVAGEPQELQGLWVVPRLWVPAAAVERRKAMRSTLEMWAKEGWLTITPGDVVDYQQIEDEIGQDAEAFRIREFAYDPWQAENLRQRLMDGGLEGWKCGQTMERLAGPAAELERLVGLGLWKNLGNPVLAWMASNTVAKRDASGRWKPEKDLSAEKIDGIVASVMGIGAQLRPREAQYAAVTAAAAVGDDRGIYGGGRLNL